MNSELHDRVGECVGKTVSSVVYTSDGGVQIDFTDRSSVYIEPAGRALTIQVSIK